MSKFTKLVTKPVRMPLNWVLPRHVVGGVKEFRFSSSRYPLCPNCSLSRFQQNEQPNKDGKVVWHCPSCEFEVQTAHSGLDAIQLWCHNNAKQVYEESVYQQDRLDDFNEGDTGGFIGINVKRNMMGCYAFLLLAAVISTLFFYAAYTVQLFFMLNTFLFVVASVFMAVIFNYRAWQAMSNNLYNQNGKQQFHWWLKTHPWFRQPRDIGVPPQSEDS